MKIDEQNFTSYVTSIVVGKVLCVYMYDYFDGIVCRIIQVTENNTQNHTFHWNDNSYKYLLTSSNTLLTTVNVPFNFPLVLLYTYDSHWDPDSVLFFVYIFFDVSFPSCLHVISNNSYCCYVLVSWWYLVVNLCKYYHYMNIHNLNPVVYYLESRNNLDKIKLLLFFSFEYDAVLISNSIYWIDRMGLRGETKHVHIIYLLTWIRGLEMKINWNWIGVF